MRAYEPFKESRFETKHVVTVKGRQIPFKAVAEDFVFPDENGEPEASIFSISYISCEEGKKADRPVLFVWDGGAGCGMGMQNTMFFGPWRIKNEEGSQFRAVNPPYELEENPNFLIDVCDVVVVDPAGTGFGMVKPEAESKYFSVEGDADAMADFIENWLTAYGRWNSPRFISGTSYGSIRNARVLEEMNGGAFCGKEQRSVSFKGAVQIGNISWLNESQTNLYPEGHTPTAFLMKTMAASNCYHNECADNIYDFANEAEDWAFNVLDPALASGELSDEQKAELADKMAYYTGLPAEMLLAMELNVPAGQVWTGAALAAQGKDAGYYDSRMTLDQNPLIGVPDMTGDDPGMGVYCPAIISVMNGLYKERLGITFNRHYMMQNFHANMTWDASWPKTIDESLPPKSHTQCLVSALRRNEKMKIMFVTGLFDFCTLASANKYLAQTAGFPADRTIIKEYLAGHEAYSDYEVGRQFAADLRAFIGE